MIHISIPTPPIWKVIPLKAGIGYQVGRPTMLFGPLDVAAAFTGAGAAERARIVAEFLNAHPRFGG